MTFKVKDENGNIIDKHLSYEHALLYVDSSTGRRYTMEPMKEDDQNDCDSL